MLSIAENIKELIKILNEVPFDKEVALEFLDAISENGINLEMEIDSLNDEIKVINEDNNSKDSQISELEELLEVDENSIQCGIGKIKYETDNALLEMIMENLDAAIQKHNALRVNEKLTTLM